jgi:glycosyltransferase involved in cell wall biosynthesis
MILWESLASSGQSLGIVGERSALALRRLGAEVVFRPLNLSWLMQRRMVRDADHEKEIGMKWGPAAWDDLLPETRQLVEESSRGISVEQEQRAVAVTWGAFGALVETRWKMARVYAGYTFYDYAAPPDEGVRICNQMDLLFVPSTFTRDCLLQGGVRVPIHVWPHGVDPQEWSPTGAPDANRTRERFRFLFVGVASPRKGIEELLAAFSLAFPPQVKDVELVVKSADWGGLDRWKAAYPDPRITWLHQALTRRALVDVFRSCDCFVMPTRAESFCLPILEAMAAGLPVIYTDYGGHRDFCSPEVGYAVPVARMQPVERGFWERTVPFIGTPVWAVVDVAALAEILRNAYQRRDDMVRKGRRAVEVARGWTWEAGAQRALRVLLRVVVRRFGDVTGTGRCRDRWVHAGGGAKATHRAAQGRRARLLRVRLGGRGRTSRAALAEAGPSRREASGVWRVASWPGRGAP